jgi:hypothetical protein
MGISQKRLGESPKKRRPTNTIAANGAMAIAYQYFRKKRICRFSRANGSDSSRHLHCVLRWFILMRKPDIEYSCTLEHEGVRWRYIAISPMTAYSFRKAECKRTGRTEA